MSNLFAIAYVSVLVMCLSACVTTPEQIRTERAFKRNVESWIGADDKQLVATLGYPDSERKSPDGNTVYEYVTRRAFV